MALIDAVYHEYGDRLCLENADRDLLDIDAHYIKAGGAFVVLDDAGVYVARMPCCQRQRRRGCACSGVSTWKRPCAVVPGGHS
jgi:hypothetical protein